MKIAKPKNDTFQLSIGCLQESQYKIIEKICQSQSPMELNSILQNLMFWPWERGSIFCWAPVLNLFDDYLSIYILNNRLGSSISQDLCREHLTLDEHMKDVDCQLIVNILSFTLLILENCNSRILYSSAGLLISLLDSFNPLIVHASLECLCYISSLIFKKEVIPTDYKFSTDLSLRIPDLCSNPLDDIPVKYLYRHCVRTTSGCESKTEEKMYYQLNETSSGTTNENLVNEIENQRSCLISEFNLSEFVTSSSSLENCGNIVSLYTGLIQLDESKLSTSFFIISNLDNKQIQFPLRSPDCKDDNGIPDGQEIRIPYVELLDGFSVYDIQKMSLVEMAKHQQTIFMKLLEKYICCQNKSIPLYNKQMQGLRQKIKVIWYMCNPETRRYLVDIRLHASTLFNLFVALLRNDIQHRVLSSLLGFNNRDGLFPSLFMKFLEVFDELSKPIPDKMLLSTLPENEIQYYRWFEGNDNICHIELLNELDLKVKESISRQLKLVTSRGTVPSSKDILRDEVSFTDTNELNCSDILLESQKNVEVNPIIYSDEIKVNKDLNISSSSSKVNIVNLSNRSSELASTRNIRQVFIKKVNKKDEYYMRKWLCYPFSLPVENLSIKNRYLLYKEKTCVMCMPPSEVDHLTKDTLFIDPPGIAKYISLQLRCKVFSNLIAVAGAAEITSSVTAFTHSSILQKLIDCLNILDPIYLPVVISICRLFENLSWSRPGVTSTYTQVIYAFKKIILRLQYEVATLSSIPVLEGFTPRTKTYFSSHFNENILDNYSHQLCHYGSFLLDDSNDLKWYNVLETIQELSSRRFLIQLLYRAMDVCLSIPNSNSQAQMLNDVNTEEMITATRVIFQHPYHFGLTCYTAAVSFASDFIYENPSIQSTVIRDYLMPDFFGSVSMFVTSKEESFKAVCKCLSVIQLHEFGEKDYKDKNKDAFSICIRSIIDENLIGVDRAAEVSRYLGAIMAKIIMCQPEESEWIIDLSVDILSELVCIANSLPKWKVIPADVAKRKLEEYLMEAPFQLFDLKLPCKPCDLYICDRIAYVCSYLHSLLSPSVENQTLFLEKGGALNIYSLLMSQCLPPMCYRVMPFHPLHSLIVLLTSSTKYFLLTSEANGNSFIHHLQQNSKTAVSTLTKLSNLYLYTDNLKTKTIFNETSSQSEIKNEHGYCNLSIDDSDAMLRFSEDINSMDDYSLRVKLYFSVWMIDLSLYFIYKIYQSFVLNPGSFLDAKTKKRRMCIKNLTLCLKPLYSVFPLLVKFLYRHMDNSESKSSIILSNKHHAHEHPGMRASRLDHYTDDQSVEYNFFWSSLSLYAYSIPNDILEKSFFSSNTCTSLSETDPTLNSTVLLEMIRSTAIQYCSVFSVASRLLNIIITESNSESTASLDFFLNNNMHIDLAFMAKDFFSNVPRIPLLRDFFKIKRHSEIKKKKTASIGKNELNAKKNDVSLDLNNCVTSTKGANEIRVDICDHSSIVSIPNLTILQSIKYLTQVMEILNRMQIKKNQDFLNTLTLDTHLKCGIFKLIFRTLHYCFGIHTATIITLLVIEFNITVEQGLLACKAAFMITNSAFIDWLSQIVNTLLENSIENLKTLRDAALKSLHCSLAYFSKISRFKSFFKSPVTKYLQKMFSSPFVGKNEFLNNNNNNNQKTDMAIKSLIESQSTETPNKCESSSSNVLDAIPITEKSSNYSECVNQEKNQSNPMVSMNSYTFLYPYPIIGSGHLEEFNAISLIRSLQSEIVMNLLIWIEGLVESDSKLCLQDMNFYRFSEAFFVNFPSKAVTCLLLNFRNFLYTECMLKKKYIISWISENSPSQSFFAEKKKFLQCNKLSLAQSTIKDTVDTSSITEKNSSQVLTTESKVVNSYTLDSVTHDSKMSNQLFDLDNENADYCFEDGKNLQYHLMKSMIMVLDEDEIVIHWSTSDIKQLKCKLKNIIISLLLYFGYRKSTFSSDIARNVLGFLVLPVILSPFKHKSSSNTCETHELKNLFCNEEYSSFYNSYSRILSKDKQDMVVFSQLNVENTQQLTVYIIDSLNEIYYYLTSLEDSQQCSIFSNPNPFKRKTFNCETDARLILSLLKKKKNSSNTENCYDQFDNYFRNFEDTVFSNPFHNTNESVLDSQNKSTQIGSLLPNQQTVNDELSLNKIKVDTTYSDIVLGEDSYFCYISRYFHNRLYCLFFVLVTLLHGSPIVRFTLISKENSAVEFFLKFISLFTDFRKKSYDTLLSENVNLPSLKSFYCNESEIGIAFKNSENCKYSFSNLSVPKWCLYPCSPYIAENSKTYKQLLDAYECILINSDNKDHLDTSSINILFQKTANIPTFMLPPDWFVSSFVGILLVMKYVRLDSVFDKENFEIINSKMPVSKIYNNKNKNDQKHLIQSRLIITSLDTIFYFPGLNGSLSLVLLSLLVSLTSILSNISVFMDYNPITQFYTNSSILKDYLPFPPLMGGGLGILLQLPRSAYFKGILSLFSALISNLCISYSGLQERIKRDLLRYFKSKEKHFYRSDNHCITEDCDLYTVVDCESNASLKKNHKSKSSNFGKVPANILESQNKESLYTYSLVQLDDLFVNFYPYIRRDFDSFFKVLSSNCVFYKKISSDFTQIRNDNDILEDENNEKPNFTSCLPSQSTASKKSSVHFESQNESHDTFLTDLKKLSDMYAQYNFEDNNIIKADSSSINENVSRIIPILLNYLNVYLCIHANTRLTFYKDILIREMKNYSYNLDNESDIYFKMYPFAIIPDTLLFLLHDLIRFNPHYGMVLLEFPERKSCKSPLTSDDLVYSTVWPTSVENTDNQHSSASSLVFIENCLHRPSNMNLFSWLIHYIFPKCVVLASPLSVATSEWKEGLNLSRNQITYGNLHLANHYNSTYFSASFYTSYHLCSHLIHAVCNSNFKLQQQCFLEITNILVECDQKAPKEYLTKKNIFQKVTKHANEMEDLELYKLKSFTTDIYFLVVYFTLVMLCSLFQSLFWKNRYSTNFDDEKYKYSPETYSNIDIDPLCQISNYGITKSVSPYDSSTQYFKLSTSDIIRLLNILLKILGMIDLSHYDSSCVFNKLIRCLSCLLYDPVYILMSLSTLEIDDIIKASSEFSSISKDLRCNDSSKNKSNHVNLKDSENKSQGTQPPLNESTIRKTLVTLQQCRERQTRIPDTNFYNTDCLSDGHEQSSHDQSTYSPDESTNAIVNNDQDIECVNTELDDEDDNNIEEVEYVDSSGDDDDDEDDDDDDDEDEDDCDDRDVNMDSLEESVLLPLPHEADEHENPTRRFGLCLNCSRDSNSHSSEDEYVDDDNGEDDEEDLNNNIPRIRSDTQEPDVMLSLLPEVLSEGVISEYISNSDEQNQSVHLLASEDEENLCSDFLSSPSSSYSSFSLDHNVLINNVSNSEDGYDLVDSIVLEEDGVEGDQDELDETVTFVNRSEPNIQAISHPVYSIEGSTNHTYRFGNTANSSRSNNGNINNLPYLDDFPDRSPNTLLFQDNFNSYSSIYNNISDLNEQSRFNRNQPADRTNYNFASNSNNSTFEIFITGDNPTSLVQLIQQISSDQTNNRYTNQTSNRISGHGNSFEEEYIVSNENPDTVNINSPVTILLPNESFNTSSRHLSRLNDNGKNSALLRIGYELLYPGVFTKNIAEAIPWEFTQDPLESTDWLLLGSSEHIPNYSNNVRNKSGWLISGDLTFPSMHPIFKPKSNVDCITSNHTVRQEDYNHSKLSIGFGNSPLETNDLIGMQKLNNIFNSNSSLNFESKPINTNSKLKDENSDAKVLELVPCGHDSANRGNESITFDSVYMSTSLDSCLSVFNLYFDPLSTQVLKRRSTQITPLWYNITLSQNNTFSMDQVNNIANSNLAYTFNDDVHAYNSVLKSNIKFFMNKIDECQYTPFKLVDQFSKKINNAKRETTLLSFDIPSNKKSTLLSKNLPVSDNMDSVQEKMNTSELIPITSSHTSNSVSNKMSNTANDQTNYDSCTIQKSFTELNDTVSKNALSFSSAIDRSDDNLVQYKTNTALNASSSINSKTYHTSSDYSVPISTPFDSLSNYDLLQIGYTILKLSELKDSVIVNSKLVNHLCIVLMIKPSQLLSLMSIDQNFIEAIPENFQLDILLQQAANLNHQAILALQKENISSVSVDDIKKALPTLIDNPLGLKWINVQDHQQSSNISLNPDSYISKTSDSNMNLDSSSSTCVEYIPQNTISHQSSSSNSRFTNSVLNNESSSLTIIPTSLSIPNILLSSLPKPVRSLISSSLHSKKKLQNDKSSNFLKQNETLLGSARNTQLYSLENNISNINQTMSLDIATQPDSELPTLNSTVPTCLPSSSPVNPNVNIANTHNNQNNTPSGSNPGQHDIYTVSNDNANIVVEEESFASIDRSTPNQFYRSLISNNDQYTRTQRGANHGRQQIRLVLNGIPFNRPNFHNSAVSYSRNRIQQNNSHVSESGITTADLHSANLLSRNIPNSTHLNPRSSRMSSSNSEYMFYDIVQRLYTDVVDAINHMAPQDEVNFSNPRYQWFSRNLPLNRQTSHPHQNTLTRSGQQNIDNSTNVLMSSSSNYNNLRRIRDNAFVNINSQNLRDIDTSSSEGDHSRDKVKWLSTSHNNMIGNKLNSKYSLYYTMLNLVHPHVPNFLSIFDNAVDLLSLLIICRILYAETEYRLDTYNLFFSLASSYPKLRKNLLEVLIFMVWASAEDINENNKKKHYSQANVLDFPPKKLFSQTEFTTVMHINPHSETAAYIGSLRALEHLRSLLRMIPEVSDFFSVHACHPSCLEFFIYQENKKKMESYIAQDKNVFVNVSSSFEVLKNEKKRHFSSLNKSVNFVPSNKNSFVERKTNDSTFDTKISTEPMTSDISITSSRLESNIKSNVNLPNSSSPLKNSSLAKPSTQNVKQLYPINILFILTSSIVFQMSEERMTHLLSAISFLVCGSDDNVKGSHKSTEPTVSNTESLLEPSTSSHYVNANSEDSLQSDSDEINIGINTTNDNDVDMVNTQSDPVSRNNYNSNLTQFNSVYESPINYCNYKNVSPVDKGKKFSSLNRILNVISSEAIESICRFFTGMTYFTHNNFNSTGFSNFYQVLQSSTIPLCKIIHTLYWNTKHHDTVKRILIKLIKRLVSHVKKLLECVNSFLEDASPQNCCTTSEIPNFIDVSLESLLGPEHIFNSNDSIYLLYRVISSLQDIFCAISISYSNNDDKKNNTSNLSNANPNQNYLEDQSTEFILTNSKSTHTTYTGTDCDHKDNSKIENGLKELNMFLELIDIDSLWGVFDTVLTNIQNKYKPESLDDAIFSNVLKNKNSADEHKIIHFGTHSDQQHSQFFLQEFTNSKDFISSLSLINIPTIIYQFLPLLNVYFITQQIGIAADFNLLPYQIPYIGSPFIDAKTSKRLQFDFAEYVADLYNMSENKESQRHKNMYILCNKHKQILNLLIEESPSYLNTTFHPMIALVPYCVSLENKRHYFRQCLKQIRGKNRYDSIRLNVRRHQVFIDSFHKLRMKTGDQLKGKLIVHFQGEEGVDAGGLTREWFAILAKEMFNPDYALFRREGSKLEFNHPNSLSEVNPDHLFFFRFVGQALYDGQHIAAYFTRSFYKQIIGRKVTPADAESVDPELYRNLQILLQHNVDDLGLDLHFCTDIDKFGQTQVVDLIPNGRNIPVTEENKYQYVNLVCEYKVSKGIEPQINAFMQGFHELIPRKLLIMFHDKELELLISGMPFVDLTDLKENTEYHGYDATSDQIKWFWEVLHELDQIKLASFLQFVTGTSRVPLGGFKELMGMRGSQPFSINKDCSETRLPSAHTCINQLELPTYPSKHILKNKLLQAISEGSDSFSLV